MPPLIETLIEEKVKEFRKGNNVMNVSDPSSDTEWIENFIRESMKLVSQEAEKAERERIEAVFEKELSHHKFNLEDSTWLARLMNKAFLTPKQ